MLNKIPIIPRLEDLPYWRSPASQFSLSQSSTLSFGQYIWRGANAGRVGMTGAKNITKTTMMYVRSVSISADISLLDYQKALEITTTVVANSTVAGTPDIPRFFMFLQADHNAPTLKDPILCRNYIDNQDYRILVQPKQLPDLLSGFFRGTLQQTGALAGINSVTLTAEFYLQMIDDKNFIDALKLGYPSLDTKGYVKL